METLTRRRTMARAGRSTLHWTIRLLAAVACSTLWVGSASAQTPVKLNIDIRAVLAQDCMDIVPCDGASFYARVIFDGAIHSNIRQTSQWYGRDQIFPNWSFVWPTHSQDVVNVDVEIWDEDGFFRGADDQLDLDPTPGSTVDARRLSFQVDINECLNGTNGGLTGDLSGACRTQLSSTGREVGWRGTIRLDVGVETPPTAPGLRVRCLHSPIWPQPGDTVTVSAESLDGAEVSKQAVSGADLEIWMNGGSAPAKTCTGSSCVLQVGPVQGSSMSYGCRVKKSGQEAWSGWRTTQVGNPSGNGPVPVVLTGSPASSIDVVLVATGQTCTAGGCINYTSALDSTFLNRAHEVIQDAFYSWDVHLKNQDALNFWIATDMGNAALGVLDAPAGWSSTYAFADVGAILHENPFRDQARPSDRLFSSEPYFPSTIMHEAGHSPFGLIDEYCCDTYYTERATLPNVYGSEASCRADVPDLRRFDPTRSLSDCRQLSRTRVDGTRETVGWWVSDPPTNDLMAGIGNHTPNAADIRRIEWIYRACRESSCWDVRP